MHDAYLNNINNNNIYIHYIPTNRSPLYLSSCEPQPPHFLLLFMILLLEKDAIK